jgi:hypothetical protein
MTYRHTTLYLEQRHRDYIERKAISLTKYVKRKLEEDMSKEPRVTDHKLKSTITHDQKTEETKKGETRKK